MNILICLTLIAARGLKLSKYVARTSPSDFVNEEINANFPRRASIELTNVNVKIPVDACKADVLISFTRAGFGSKMNNAMNQLGLAAYGQFSAAFAAGSPFMAEWKSLFNQTLPICSSANRGLFNISAHFFKKLEARDPKFLIDFKRSLYQKYYQLQSDAQARVTQDLESIGLGPETKYIGVHIRRGDKIKEAKPLPNQIYGEEIKKELTTQGETKFSRAESYASYVSLANRVKKAIDQNTDLKTVFIASDDIHAKAAMTNLLGDSYKILGFNATTWGGSRHAAKAYGNTNYMFSVLTDVEALRLSEVFIGTGSSGMGKLAFYLRDAKKRSVSLDSGGSWTASQV